MYLQILECLASTNQWIWSPEHSRSQPAWQASEGEGEGKDERKKRVKSSSRARFDFLPLLWPAMQAISLISRPQHLSPAGGTIVAVTNQLTATKTYMNKVAKKLVTFTKCSAIWQEYKRQYLIMPTTYLESSDFFLKMSVGLLQTFLVEEKTLK